MTTKNPLHMSKKQGMKFIHHADEERATKKQVSWPDKGPQGWGQPPRRNLGTKPHEESLLLTQTKNRGWDLA